MARLIRFVWLFIIIIIIIIIIIKIEWINVSLLTIKVIEGDTVFRKRWMYIWEKFETETCYRT